MSQDLLQHLPRPTTRHRRFFVPAQCNPRNANELLPLFEELSERTLNSAEELEKWIRDWSELESVIREEESRLYINMTSFTNDQDNAEAFSDFIEDVEPRLTPFRHKLNLKLRDSEYRKDLSDYYNNWFRDVDTAIELYREENIQLETRIALEVQEYQKVTGGMSVEYDGKVRTLSQMNPFLENQDRKVREEAWRMIAQRRLRDKDSLNQHFDRLFAMRQDVAKNCGYTDYLDYIFKAKGRYDYTPDDCRTFHDSVEKYVVPLARKINEKRKAQMKLDVLRPWDTACDPLGRPPLRPFENAEGLIAGAAKIFNTIDQELNANYQQMSEMKLLDLESRLGKAPGGYQCSLDEYRLPFIFMNASGTNSDLFTLLHESGHSFHQFAMEPQDLVFYRDLPAEFAEVASMSMELLGMDHLGSFYPAEEAERAKQEQLEDVFRLLPWVATVDAFQIWMYSHPNHTQEDRKNYWLELLERFDTGINWDGLEEEKAFSWQRQLHLFEVPFYYIEYGIAQLGALQLWKNYREDSCQALAQYKAGLALGNSKPLPDLFSTAGIRFDFSAETIVPLMELLSHEVKD